MRCLAEDHLGEALLVGLVVVVLVAIDERDEIRVLLDAVMNRHVFGDEVVQSVDGQVVDVVVSVGLDRHDPVPEDVARGETA